MNRIQIVVLASAVLVWLGGTAASQENGANGGKQLPQTPTQIEGPFYPDKLPPDTDNDLLIVNESNSPAKGAVTHLSGKVLGANGQPIRNAVVEIWQVDGNGIYLHSGSHERQKFDKNFQGFGRCITGPNGEYYFRTLKPVPYTFRTPHIHFIVKKSGKRLLTTQIYIKGEKLNKKDFLFNRLSPKAQDAVLVDFLALKGNGPKTGELSARFDIVVGLTPEIIDND